MKIGDRLPDLVLADQNGKAVNLTELGKGSALVVYFYPKDGTPGCTREACSFRDSYSGFEEAGAEIVGISGDSAVSHKKFAEKHHINFTLLSDPEKTAEKAFNVPRNFLGLLPGRATYVFDRSGILIGSFNSQTRISRHVQEALKALKG